MLRRIRSNSLLPLAENQAENPIWKHARNAHPCLPCWVSNSRMLQQYPVGGQSWWIIPFLSMVVATLGPQRRCSCFLCDVWSAPAPNLQRFRRWELGLLWSFHQLQGCVTILFESLASFIVVMGSIQSIDISDISRITYIIVYHHNLSHLPLWITISAGATDPESGASSAVTLQIGEPKVIIIYVCIYIYIYIHIIYIYICVYTCTVCITRHIYI